MKLEAERFTIKLPRPFRIAHGSSLTRETILVHIQDEGFDAHGEGALPPYYPSTAEAALSWLNSIGRKGDVTAWENECAGGAPAPAAAARVALEIALQDLRAQKEGKPLWQLWGLEPSAIPPCWRTVSLASSEDELCDLLDEAISHGSTFIKLKTGSGDFAWDERSIHLAGRRNVRLGLDVNEGWTPAQAAQILPKLSELNVAFVEQPVGREIAEWRELRIRMGEGRIPSLVADESLQEQEDFARLRGLVDGANVKLLKAGGLRPALEWISLARELGMLVMVGVMIETGIARTAAAQLAPLADWLDIDPPDSIPAAPMIGFQIHGNRLVLSDRPGLGLMQVASSETTYT
jgi:L-alanine-DL-glutamate epimerase-like enolase superfamily enzyme